MPKPEILVVEDDTDLRDAVREVLELEGYAVICASQGQEGLELLNRGAPPGPNLIFLDLMMPVMNGAEFLDQLQRGDGWQARIPVVVFSAAGNRLSHLPGAAQIVKKPIELENLLQIARKYVRT